jgi:alcohol dehydrogenase
MSMNGTWRFLPLPTEIHFGNGIVSTLPDRLRALGCSKPLIVTDAGMRAAGTVARVEQLLSVAGVNAGIYDGVTADSGTTLIEEAVGQAREIHADAIIGLGGGSSLDTAKAVAAMVTNSGSILDYIGIDKLPRKGIPVIAIPTAAGTGSEVTFWSVFLDDRTRLKVAVGGVLVYPDVALCDPELTLTLPPPATAATGMDALGHAVECYVNDACQPISAALALRAIELIGQHLRGAALNGRQVESRYAMMLASTIAGIAMNSTRLGLAHALAMPLGSYELRIPHGLIIGITLPYVMKFNHAARFDRYAAIARALGENVDGLSPADAASRSFAAVAALGRDIGIPARLSDVGLREEHVNAVAAEAVKSGNVAVNPRRACVEDLRNILREAL